MELFLKFDVLLGNIEDFTAFFPEIPANGVFYCLLVRMNKLFEENYLRKRTRWL